MATAEQEFHARDEDDDIGVELVSLPGGDPMIDVQVTTAKRYPRSVARFRKEAMALACLDEETAGECMYALPRGGKTIEGPSARLAEILMYAWGNARADAEVVDEGPTHITAQGTFFDLERNVAVRKKVKRRITDRRGNRYDDDMIGVTGNAANSIAFRNAVFAGIPKALWKGIYMQARLASIGQAGTLTQTRQKMVEHFGKMGVEPAKLFALLGVQGLEDVSEDHVITLRGLANAIRDGEATVESTFAAARNAGDAPDLNERIRAKAGSTQRPPVETGTTRDDKKRLAAARQAFDATLTKKRPDIAGDMVERAQLIADVCQTGDEDTLVVSDYTRLTQYVESLPVQREPGSDDE